MIKKLSKGLLYFNFGFVIVIAILIFMYGVYDYVINPISSFGTDVLGLSSTGLAMTSINTIINIFLTFPTIVDWFFFVTFLTMVIDLIYLSFKAKQMSEWAFLGAVLFYVPLVLFILTKVKSVMDSFIQSLSSILTTVPPLPLYTFLMNNSIAITAVIFIVCLGINVIPWNVVREKLMPSQTEEEYGYYENE